MQYRSVSIISFNRLKSKVEEYFSESLINDKKDDILWEIEADSYNCFTAMMNKIQNNYTNNQPGITKMMKKMEEIIKLVDVELFNFLELHEINFILRFIQYDF